MTTQLTNRTTWAVAKLAELINEGRAAGWLAGEPLEGVEEADSVLPTEIDDTSPMQQLAVRLELSSSELDLLWLLACVEMEPILVEEVRCLVPAGTHELTAQLVDRLFHGFADLQKLARLGLIEMSLDPRLPLYRRVVRASDRTIELARGRLVLDRELGTLVTLDPVSSRTLAADDADDTVMRALDARDAIVIARGKSGAGRAASLRGAAWRRGWNVMTIRVAELDVDPERLVRQLGVIARECRLHCAVPLLVEIDRADARGVVIERELLRGWRGPVMATCRELPEWISRAPVVVDVELPDVVQRAVLWSEVLEEAEAGTTAEVASRYTISAEQIATAAAAARVLAPDGARVSSVHVHVALRNQLERRLIGVAKRIEVTQTWDDLVLPVDELDMLVELVARARHRRLVFDDWGLAAKVGRGTGIAALLSGPPGTGKTMIAGLVARELGLDLYQVDLSRIMSKYIGETEKQLAELFDAAECGHAILLFDEADSLFGKRTEVRSSNDRYANLEVNYLLQRMESFTGISLLTTNHETAIDAAFMRRLAFHIRIPIPEAEQRAQIWRAMLPAVAADAALDLASLGERFAMTGGYIKNAVVRAAFLAAEAGGMLTDAHLARAAHLEYEAMGKIAHHANR